MKVLGIDPSSKKVAITSFDRGGELEGHALFVTKNVDPAHRCAEISEWFARYLKETDSEVYIFLESPLVGRGGVKTTMTQSYIHGVLMAAAVQYEALGVYHVNVQAWKKAVVGRGNATKDDVAGWLAVERPDLSAACGGDQDLIDATCIGLYGVEAVRKALRSRTAGEGVGETSSV